jgi:hypothetical protein
VRKDNDVFAEIPIRISEERLGEERHPSPTRGVDYFVIETKGNSILLPNGGTLDLVRGDHLKIIDIMPSFSGSSEITVNFKGFVGNVKNNTGEDRGYLIYTGAGLLTRYSLGKKGELYEIIASEGDRVLGRMVVRLAPPKMDYLILKVNNHRHVYIKAEDTLTLAMEDRISLEKIQTNLYSDREIRLRINGHSLKPGQAGDLATLCAPEVNGHYPVQVMNGPLVLGKVFIRTE